MLTLAIFGIVLALVFFWLASRYQRASGMPAGKVIYTDTRAWGKVEEPLYDSHLGLTGKPDYLVRSGDQVIPVEVKSTRAPSGPLDSHIYQLAAYCLLVERVYGKRPAYGLIHYPNRTYQVDFTPTLEKNTLALLEEMRSADNRKHHPNRSHNSPARCARCGFRSLCDQRLK